MKRFVYVGILAIAIVGVLLFIRGQNSDAGLTRVRATDGAELSRSVVPTASADAQGRNALGSAGTIDNNGNMPTSTQSSAYQSADLPPSTGPRTLTMANERRLDALAADLAMREPRQRDFLQLAKSEKRDPNWSDNMERMLQASIQNHGSELTGLEVGVPYCSRTLCKLVATGGRSTADANANWQRLMGAVMNEPWFGQNFDDTSTSVTGDAKGVMYITYFVRSN